MAVVFTEETLTEREQRARTLEAAALEIEVNGWARCDRRSDGAMCVNGAIFTTLGWDGEIWSPRWTLAHRNACSVWGRGYRYEDIADFNDRHDAAAATFLLRWRAEEIRDGWDA